MDHQEKYEKKSEALLKTICRKIKLLLQNVLQLNFRRRK